VISADIFGGVHKGDGPELPQGAPGVQAVRQEAHRVPLYPQGGPPLLHTLLPGVVRP